MKLNFDLYEQVNSLRNTIILLEKLIWGYLGAVAYVIEFKNKGNSEKELECANEVKEKQFEMLILLDGLEGKIKELKNMLAKDV